MDSDRVYRHSLEDQRTKLYLRFKLFRYSDGSVPHSHSHRPLLFWQLGPIPEPGAQAEHREYTNGIHALPTQVGRKIWWKKVSCLLFFNLIIDKPLAISVNNHILFKSINTRICFTSSLKVEKCFWNLNRTQMNLLLIFKIYAIKE